MLSLMNSAPWISTDLYIFVLLLKATNKACKCHMILLLSVKFSLLRATVRSLGVSGFSCCSSDQVKHKLIFESDSVMSDQNALNKYFNLSKSISMHEKAVKI